MTEVNVEFFTKFKNIAGFIDYIKKTYFKGDKLEEFQDNIKKQLRNDDVVNFVRIPDEKIDEINCSYYYAFRHISLIRDNDPNSKLSEALKFYEETKLVVPNTIFIVFDYILDSQNDEETLKSQRSYVMLDNYEELQQYRTKKVGEEICEEYLN